jgi:hypothetical protein
LLLSDSHNSSMALRNPLNRPLRTRMSGGVAGESGRPLPLCRFGTPRMFDSVELKVPFTT